MECRGYPVELRLQGKTVLVVGLGQVGRRKLAALVEAGARVIAVDPDPAGLDPVSYPGVEVRIVPYDRGQLEGVRLVVAAGPPEVNRRVVRDARDLGVWVSSVSEPEEGDFALPAVWRSGPVVLTVSTTGASPALAAMLRDRAAAALGPAAAGLAALLAELRPYVRETVRDPQTRRTIFLDWADPRWLDLWLAEGPERTREALLRSIHRQ